MPFFRYAAAVRHCVAISTPKIYLSKPSGTPPFAHLKQRRAVVISIPSFSGIDIREFSSAGQVVRGEGMGYTCRDKIPIGLIPAYSDGICTRNSTKGLEVGDNGV